MLTFGNINKQGKLKQKRRVVVIIGRVHGGESPSSFVCQGKIYMLYLKRNKTEIGLSHKSRPQKTCV